VYKSLKGKIPKKPRTYRKIARKNYLAVTGATTTITPQKNPSPEKTTAIYQKKPRSY
jgi:hypothetical protein